MRKHIVTLSQDGSGLHFDWGTDTMNPNDTVNALADAIGLVYGLVIQHQPDEAGDLDNLMHTIRVRVANLSDRYLAGEVPGSDETEL